MQVFETVYLTLGNAQFDGAALLVAFLALASLGMGAIMTGVAFASTRLYQRLPAGVFAVLTLAPGALLAFALVRDTLAAL